MITHSQTQAKYESWEDELRNCYRDTDALLTAVGLPQQLNHWGNDKPEFPLRVPASYVRKIKIGDPDDPLLRQVLATINERETYPGFRSDPIGELDAPTSGSLLQKYHGRALILLTGACAIHCRYCFRRAFPYSERLGKGALNEALDAIARDPSLSEVIFSGGDPLIRDDAFLTELIGAVANIAHVQRLRIHTRIPVVLPSRITPALLRVLETNKVRSIVVIHANHAQELDEETALALDALRSAGVALLNQSVLLKGVNDDAEILCDLSERLFSCGVLPYYVHLLDKVSGSAQFDVSDAQALEIEARLRARLPGYLVPKFVREVAGEPAKQPLRQ
ncbi:MAG: EF-P beta-lysylation protein EpmB [Pseudomonadota bacterium]